MAIIKSKHASNYTVIPNEVFKIGLSLDAVGLLTYLLSMPNDWVIYKTTIHNQFKISRKRMDYVFNELKNAGYIISDRKHIEGRLEWEHIVYDKPFNGEPIQHTQNNTIENNTIENNHIEINNIHGNDIKMHQLISTNKQSKELQSKKEKSKDKEIPTFKEFLEYAALNKPYVCEATLKLKYESWVVNDWKTGNDTQIKNWKKTLLNTLPYIKEGNNSINLRMQH